jgi:capsular polysaccharide biosynthesis protein
MYVLIAFACSLVVAVILAVIVEKLDKTVKDEEDFLKSHNVPLLGTVPDFEAKGKRRIVE